MCMHMCSACYQHSSTQSVLFSIHIYLSFIMPVRWAIRSEVWSCDKQGFTVCRHSVSAAGEHIFLIAHAGLFTFCWYKQVRTLPVYFGVLLYSDNEILVSPNSIVPLLGFLLPDGVTDTIYSTHVSLLSFATLVSPGFQHGFILTAVILCAVSH